MLRRPTNRGRGARRARRWRAWLAGGALAALGCSAIAPSSWPIDPGDSVALAPDQGLLVVHIRTNRHLQGIFIDRVRAAEDVPEGTRVALIGITAGVYRWSDVELQRRTFRFRDIDRLRFRIVPGAINYVGMVDIEETEDRALVMDTVDRSAIALAELRERYPDLVAKYPVVYSGTARHVFLARYAAAKRSAKPASPRAEPAPQRGPADPRAIEALFRAPAVQMAALNPAGTLCALLGFVSGTQVVTVRRTNNAASTIVFSDKGPVEVVWEDDDTLIVLTDQGTRAVVIDLELLEFGVVSTQHEIRARGWLIDPLPLVSGQVLWADWDGEYSSVFLIPVAELIGQKLADPKYRVAKLSARVFEWISDPQGVPRAALALASENPLRFALDYRESDAAPWREVGNWTALDSIPVPLGLAADGRDLLVASAEGSGTRALRRYRVAERQLGEVIYAQPGADLVGAVFGYQGLDVIAVYWDEAGIRRYHYFDEIDAAQQAWLDELHPGEAVHLISRSADQRLFIVLVSGPRNPGQLQLLDASRHEIENLGAVMPWIPPSRLAPVAEVDVTAKDGRAIEAFFTRPVKWSGERPPLVVMPHGGPIGIADTREFDPVVQALAAQGYAVLQVNYRGSGGKGKSFLEAGMGAWGQGIEDDIESALDTVESKHWVDADRVCIFGGSYGGYSALIGITRRPQRYRCAAAVAAPSDLLLWSNNFVDSADGREWFAKVVGDPDRDREHLLAISPAYRAAEMNVPILLVQGDRDRVVDPEHAYRMRAMLEANGKSCEWMVLDGATHDPTPAQWLQLLRRVDQFLARYLNADQRGGGSALTDQS